MAWLPSLRLLLTVTITGAGRVRSLYVGGGLTILSQNNLDGADNNNSSAILVNQPSVFYAANLACQLLGEEPWNPDTADFKTTLKWSLPYQVYQGVVPQSQIYWIAKRDPDNEEECRGIDATGDVQTIDCWSEYPTLCTQSARVSSGKINDNDRRWQVQQFVGNQLVTGYRDLHVWKFRGLRYAETPKRFAYSKIQSYEDSGEIDATTAGADCSQPVGEVKNGSSEDCLFANVWTPYIPRLGETDTNAQLKPVMVYLYGGGMTSGSGKNPNTDGTNLASRGDVVVVSVNYRVGSVGFLNLNDGVQKGNYGVSDMITGLEWVKKYIRNFGGDPDRVTLFGESAGALGTHVVLGSPKAKGLFQRAILQSSPDGYPSEGKLMPAPFYDTLTNNYETTTKKVLQAAGCANASAPVACLEKLSGFDLVNLNTNANGVVQDGVYVTSPRLLLSSALSSQASNVSVMLGITRDEAGVLIDDRPASSDTLTNYLNSVASKHFSLPPNVSSMLNLPSTFTAQTGPDQIFNTTLSLLTSMVFTCPSLAKAYSAAKNRAFKEVFYFNFNRTYQTSGYTRPWCVPPKTAAYPNGDPNQEYYKCHAGEQMVVFGSSARAGLPDRDGNDAKFQGLVVDYWASFARSGRPDPDAAYLKIRGLELTRKEIERVGKWEAVNAKAPKLRLLQWGGGKGLVGFAEAGQKEVCEAVGVPLNALEVTPHQKVLVPTAISRLRRDSHIGTWDVGQSYMMRHGTHVQSHIGVKSSSAKTWKPKGFGVIIAGGGVGGLALANSLEL
ncbi:putative esterase/lipase [Podospora australis]|uniref:Esterase/lipase n=1 Tax=Podospora australis TaxID=1536484 RepID=A0AAN6WII8_9PEZI|nr:putative esterase/lipase [Podospora australis]